MSKRSSGASSSREAKVVKVVQHITINNYFAPGTAPTPPSGQATEADNLFPIEERSQYETVPWKGRTTRNVLTSRAKHDGALVRGCRVCMRPTRPMVDFAPRESHIHLRDRADFFEALHDYDVAWKARDVEVARAARAQIEKLAIVNCPSCVRPFGHLTPAAQACKDFLNEVRNAACLAQNGCLRPDCPERGPAAACVLEGDHFDPNGELDPANKKVHILGHYMWWSCHGGVEAMKLEVPKLRWLCAFCHRLEPTGTATRCRRDPETMPDGKPTGTEEERKQYEAKRHAKIKYPKQQYVDARKLDVGKCCRCDRVVASDNVWAFDWDHRDPATKLMGGLAGKQGGVAGLVNNVSVSACILRTPSFKDVLDAETDKCDLLCHNCHMRKTFKHDDDA
jgi:hypothetical protein